MFDEGVLSRSPRLGRQVRNAGNGEKNVHTLTSSAFTGLVATTLLTEGEEEKDLVERTTALGRAFENMVVD